MDDRRTARPVNDEALDHAIERVLAIDPSPEFVARVRTRIGAAPAASVWRPSWAVCFVAGAFATLVVAAVAVFLGPLTSGGPIAATPPIAARAIPSQPTLLAGGSSLREVRGSRRAASRRALQVAKNEPEVLTDPRESNAIRALIAGVRDGRVDLAPLLQPGPAPAMEPAPLTDIVITPITIDPVGSQDGPEGVRP